MMRHLFGSILLLGLSALSPIAMGAGEGTAVGVDPDAMARGTSDRTLQVGADISIGETVITGPSGQVQIIFDDQTRLVVGPNSALRVETYLLASDNTASKLAINALGGSFRFITGSSPKPAYSISTPTATIAVRGTRFDFLVDRATTLVMLYEGALQVCNPSGDCEDLVDRCQVGTAVSDSARLYIRNDPERIPLSLMFPYARFQHPLLDEFRVSDTVACTEIRENGPVPAVGTGGGGGSSTPQTPITTVTTTPQGPTRPTTP